MVANPIAAQVTQSALLTVGGQNTSGTNTFGGLVTLNQGLTISEPSGGTLNFTGGITSGSAGSQTVTFANAGAVTVNSAIGGGPGVLNVVQSGGGTTMLGATNSYAGGTAIQNGTLQLGTNNALPTSSDTLTFGLGSNHGTLDLNGNSQTISGLGRRRGGERRQSDYHQHEQFPGSADLQRRRESHVRRHIARWRQHTAGSGSRYPAVL